MGLFDITKHEARDAARLALQSAVAASSMYLLMAGLGLPEKFVGILSAVLVVEPSVGNTFGEAMNRFVATVVGSVIGLACLFLLPAGYGTTVGLAVSMLAVNAVAGIRPEWRYGVVAAVALSLGAEQNLVETTRDRCTSIGLGVVVGVLTSLVVWPDRAEKRAQRFLARALRASAERLSSAVRGTWGEGDTEAGEARAEYHRNLESARKAAAGIRFSSQELLEARIEQTERLYNSILILNRVAEETNDATDGQPEAREGVDRIRELGCVIANGLADGNADQGDRLDELQERLTAVREEALDGDERKELALLRNALVFGLDEVEDSLANLIEAFRDED